MSYAEMLSWVSYRDKHGSLNPMRRGELAAAIVALQINRGHGGKSELTDFMPHHASLGIALDRAMEEWS